jgi:hypothetical protein
MLALADWSGRHSPRPEPVALTFAGQQIDDPDRVLRDGENRVKALLATRYGVEAAMSRCYFTSDSEEAGQSPVPVNHQLACGPVFLTGGDSLHPYVVFQMAAEGGSRGPVRLSISGDASNQLISGPISGERVVRPDGLRPPIGNGGLESPPPPPAVADLLTTAATIGSGVTQAGPASVMVGPTGGVRLLSYGFIEHYATGLRARSAPPGRRLLAFAVAAVPGELENSAPQLSVRVDGVERGPLLVSSDYIVLAVPGAAKAVELVMTDGGLKQSLSLLDGASAPDNPVVSSRRNRLVKLAVAKDIRVRVKDSTGTGVTTGVVTFSGAELSYWAGVGGHADGPPKALLHVKATVRLLGDPHAYGAEAGLISAAAKGGQAQKSRNAAADAATEVDNVVEVPANLVDGTMTYSGAVTTSKGTITVLTPITVPFTIPAG